MLDYAPTPKPSELGRLATAFALRVGVAVLLFLLAIVVPHPEGIWYFGNENQWLLAIDFNGVLVGPISNPTSLGWSPLLFGKLAVVALPIWLIWHFFIRRRSNPSLLT